MGNVSWCSPVTFHNQLTTIDSLDDCGSFAVALLEVMKDHEIPEGRKKTLHLIM